MAQNFGHHSLASPVLGLAPMDGITDKAYRAIQKKYGNPDIMFTEFTNVIGLCKGALSLFRDLDYEEAERPIIAQLFGSDPEHFRHAVKIVLALGFDGVDINMGCPAKKVTDKGGGASLIKQPEIARSIIREVRKGIQEYKETRELTGIDPSVIDIVDKYIAGRSIIVDDQLESFTVSVKTRIGYDSNAVESWIGELNKEDLDWISVHGRTLKQMYTGDVDKEALALAVSTAVCPVLVNGNVIDGSTAKDMLAATKASGILVGRGSYGDPWIFQEIRESIKGDRKTDIGGEKIKGLEEKRRRFSIALDVLLEHARLHYEFKGEAGFVQMRKHFGWYIKGFEGASKYRIELMTANTLSEVQEIVERIRHSEDI